jgi:2-oxoglutarate ferredoxin oxidoreductase subunit beta
MTYIPKPKIHHPGLKRNDRGLTVRDYEGALSTLCAGCGHDSITAAIVKASFEMNIDPVNVAKMSGIGCSSKTPAYFLSSAHGFNAVHGRMPSVTTGANAANRNMTYLAVSGDGDTASIGLGQFAHAIRRKLNMLYIVENNGCYGLTKGQFSATADVGSKNKVGNANQYDAIDPAMFAIQMGASFVARSFSGDKAQLVPLIKAGLSHRGFALIDVVSPCVTFNNHEGSTKSYSYAREHDEEVNDVSYVPVKSEITVEYKEGEVKPVTMHDGSMIYLKKVDAGYDPLNKATSLQYLQEHQEKGQIITGLLYLNEQTKEFHDVLNTVPTALRDLDVRSLCPGSAALAQINQRLR